MNQANVNALTSILTEVANTAMRRKTASWLSLVSVAPDVAKQLAEALAARGVLVPSTVTSEQLDAALTANQSGPWYGFDNAGVLEDLERLARGEGVLNEPSE